MLTKTEEQIAVQTLEATEMYPHDQLLSLKEQVSMDLFSNTNDYIKV